MATLPSACTLDLQLRTLLGQSLNGIPVISNREFQGSLTLEDGQPAVVAGEVDHTEQRSMNGIPGLGAIPGLNQIMTSNNKEDTEDELLIVITPRVIGADGTETGRGLDDQLGRLRGIDFGRRPYFALAS